MVRACFSNKMEVLGKSDSKERVIKRMHLINSYKMPGSWMLLAKRIRKISVKIQRDMQMVSLMIYRFTHEIKNQRSEYQWVWIPEMTGKRIKGSVDERRTVSNHSISQAKSNTLKITLFNLTKISHLHMLLFNWTVHD